MTTTQIENKIAELDVWLVQNPTDPHHAAVQEDKRAYERKLQLLKPPPVEHKPPTYHDLEVNNPEIINE